MPTVIPTHPEIAAAAQPLSWPDMARVLILLACVRWLNRRLQAVNRRVVRYGFDIAGTDLALTMQRWLACHEAIGALLGRPEPSHVAQVRATLQKGAERKSR
ncbi:hypothetical protein MKK69_18655 [Methylobacterium sp. J-026]|uniref:hypothetical protein n=1 Tax=Methylobacterium sp. J-026 TaxID=2836624 RepID=UPI001FB86BDA|nr:hypothetical protein [Methylobacterium sp. J-026]MCJ2136046.1 hypothetical protein [Methylobacterium sp. J-026]